MRRNRSSFEHLISEDFEAYIDRIKNEKEWVGEVEMKAVSMRYRTNFLVYYEINKLPLSINPYPSPRQTITLSCTNGNWYDCVYAKSELSVLAFCQSIVYEILYKSVFELGSDVDVAVEKMLHDKTYSKQRRNNLLGHLFRESCRIDSVAEESKLPEDDQSCKVNPRLEIRKALAQGVPPFPFKVAKTLDPGIYRNVEFDLWNEKRKEDQKQEQFITPKLEPGVKCKVYINKEIYIGHVQEVLNDKENVSVYIEELCKRCIVSSSVLEIVPVPAYKALTWQGGKTYKVYSDYLHSTSDTEKKFKRYYKKNSLDQSPTHTSVSTNLKTNSIPRCNSLPASSSQTTAIPRSNSMYCSPQLPPKKNSQKLKNHSKEIYNHPPRLNQGIPIIWSGMNPQVPTSPISIPGKVTPECYQNPSTPDVLHDFNDPGWVEGSPLKPRYSPPHAYISGLPEESYAATSMPLPIPGMSQGEHPSAPMAVYQYPVYAVPGMYVLCSRESSTVPVNVGQWSIQEGNPEVPAAVSSMYFNTPPPGLSPSMTSWIPATIANYGSTWPPGMTTTVAFSPPPLDVSHAYQSLLSPPWSPPQYLASSPHPAVAYQTPPPRVVNVPPEPSQN